MKYTRKWVHVRVLYNELDKELTRLSGDGWTLHTAFPMRIRVEGCDGMAAVCAIFFKDDPDLSGGVPR